MTSVERYKQYLKELCKDKKNVLEIGVEKGVSTLVFLESGCNLTSIDIDKPAFYTGYAWDFHQEDASSFLKRLGWKQQFDLIYLDAHYTKERLEQDVFLCKRLLRKGGQLVFNEYCDFAGHRKGEVSDFVKRWAFDNSLRYEVWPNRNGFAVFTK